MRYQRQRPFVLDDTRLRDTFGVQATPWDEAITRTMAWARTRYAPKPTRHEA